MNPIKKFQKRIQGKDFKGIESYLCLTISAREYCDIYHKNIDSYDVYGIRGSEGQLKVPAKTEVVVGYSVFPANPNSNFERMNKAIGTALIPKDQTDLEKTVEEQNEN